MLPALLGQPHDKPARQTAVFMSGGPNTSLAIRQGPWKYIQSGPRSGNTALLYDLADDLGETKNLAAQHPDKVKELTALLGQVRQATSTRPK